MSHSETKTLVLPFKKRIEKECPRIKFVYVLMNQEFGTWTQLIQKENLF